MVKKKVSKKKANKSSNNFNRNLLIGAVIIILIFVVAFNFAGKGSDEEGLAQMDMGGGDGSEDPNNDMGSKDAEVEVDASCVSYSCDKTLHLEDYLIVRVSVRDGDIPKAVTEAKSRVCEYSRVTKICIDQSEIGERETLITGCESCQLECRDANPGKNCIKAQCKAKIVTPPGPKCTIERITILRDKVTKKAYAVTAFATAEITCNVKSEFDVCEEYIVTPPDTPRLEKEEYIELGKETDWE